VVIENASSWWPEVQNLVLNLSYRRVRGLNPEPKTTMPIPPSDGKMTSLWTHICQSGMQNGESDLENLEGSIGSTSYTVSFSNLKTYSTTFSLGMISQSECGCNVLLAGWYLVIAQ